MLRFLMLLCLAAIVGGIGAAIAGQPRKGCLTNIAIGFVGAALGTYLAEVLHAPTFPRVLDVPIGWAILGAALFMGLMGALAGRR
ncbi:MAG: hypothetical protein ONB23_00440 [candidate division KSB1 bacterium]|nr:hypothetical protein [candidate division KSB1 bacterium]